MAKPISKQSNKQPSQALSAGNGIHTTASHVVAPFLSADPEAAYRHFLKEAQSIPADSIRVLNTDPTLLRLNAEKGVRFFSTVQVEITSLMPTFPVHAVLEAPTLALGVLFAYDQVVSRASDGEIADRLADCSKLRTPMLRMLEVLADPEVGLADADIVKDIRQGTGSMDKARDAVKIAAYFRKLGPTIAGKHPFTEEQINLLSEHGQWLIPQLVPRSGKAPVAEADPAAVTRDQFYTLLWNRYERLRGAVAAVRGVAGLDDLVPPLGARVAGARKSNTATPESPAAPDKAPAAPEPASAPAQSPAAPNSPVK